MFVCGRCYDISKEFNNFHKRTLEAEEKRNLLQNPPMEPSENEHKNIKKEIKSPLRDDGYGEWEEEIEEFISIKGNELHTTVALPTINTDHTSSKLLNLLKEPRKNSMARHRGVHMSGLTRAEFEKELLGNKITSTDFNVVIPANVQQNHNDVYIKHEFDTRESEFVPEGINGQAESYGGKSIRNSIQNDIVGSRTNHIKEMLETEDGNQIFNTSEKAITPTKSTKCDICNKEFAQARSIKRHKEAVHLGIQKYGCQVCNKRFSLKTNLTTHETIHTGENPFACCLCGQNFANNRYLYLHRRRNHGLHNKSAKKIGMRTTYHCNICQKSFRFQCRLSEHTKKHHTQNDDSQIKHLKSNNAINSSMNSIISYECNICLKTFRFQCRLSEHTKKHHTQNDDSQIKHLKSSKKVSTKPSTLYECSLCQKAFSFRCRLKKHFSIIHQGIKPFPCRYCDKKCTSKHLLEEHERIHTGEKPLSCNICNMHFRVLSSLRAHYEICANKDNKRDLRPFACKNLNCNFRFKKQQDLTNHERVHTSEEPYVCYVCNSKFLHMTDIELHMKTHHNETD